MNKKNIIVSFLALTIAVGAPGLVIASQETQKKPAIAYHAPRPTFASFPRDEDKQIVIPEIVIEVKPQRASYPMTVTEKCTWHWRDLVQGSGQVHVCE